MNAEARWSEDILRLETMRGIVRDYPKGSILFLQDASPQHVFVIESGLVKQVRYERDGLATIVGLSLAGSVVDSSAAISGHNHVSSAVTVVGSRLRQICVPAFRHAVEHDHAASQYVHRLHAREVRDRIVRAGELGLPALVRLTRLIADFGRAGLTADSGDDTCLGVPLSQEEIGQMIGVSREHVNRLMTRLRATGALPRPRDGGMPQPQHAPAYRARGHS